MNVVELRPSMFQNTSVVSAGGWKYVCTIMEGDRVIERTVANGDSFQTSVEQQIATTDINEFIAFLLAAIPEVECVHTAFRENHVFYVWIVVSRWHREVRESIYRQQESIIDQFPEFSFDFYIVPKEDERVEDLISQSIDKAYVRPRE